MSRNGNHEQIIVELQRRFAVNDLFEAETSGAIVGVHESRAIEAFVKLAMVGDVVLMCQEHLAHAAHCVDAF